MRRYAGSITVSLVLACGGDDGGLDDAGSEEGSSTGSVDATSATTTVSTSTTAATDAVTTAVDDGTSTDGDETGPADTSTGTAGECPDGALAAGQYDGIEIEHDGVVRSYNLYVPAGIDGSQPMPLVLNFHGYTSTPGQQQAFSQMDPVADEWGFAVAYPAGLDNSWNAGTCCGTSASTDVDDVGFALAVVADVQTRACIDDRRVYSTGMSNGGYMSYRLACEAADTFAAIAPVAGVIGVPTETCEPSRPVPVFHFHGTEDTLVPYDGGLGFNGLSVPETIAFWAEKNGCVDEAVETFAEADVHCERHSECDEGSRVELCTVEGGGHCWPGTAFCPFGTSTTTINASELMAELFADYALP